MVKHLKAEDIQLIGVAPCYNEIERGNLERFFKHIDKVVDGLVMLDDGSTDGSYDMMMENCQHVLKNEKNQFKSEQFNHQKLIDKALEVYPNLTHILNINIDGTYSPLCFREGGIMREIVADRPQVGQWNMKNIHLWRSPYWYRVDTSYRSFYLERIYVRAHSLQMRSGAHQLHLGKHTTAKTQRNLTADHHDLVSLHWGDISKKLISTRFHHYMKVDPHQVPAPDQYKNRNVFKILDEYELQTERARMEWFDPDIDLSSYPTGKPKPVSYYSDIWEYDRQKAEAYKEHFTKLVGYHSEEEQFIEVPK